MTEQSIADRTRRFEPFQEKQFDGMPPHFGNVILLHDKDGVSAWSP